MKSSVLLATAIMSSLQICCYAQEAKTPTPEMEKRKAEMANRFFEAPSAKAPDDVLRGLHAVHVSVRRSPREGVTLNDPASKELASTILKRAGIEVLPGEGFPVLELLLDAVDVGKGAGFAFNIDLALNELATVRRGDSFLITSSKTWKDGAFGVVANADIEAVLKTALTKAFTQFGETWRKNNPPAK